MLKERACETWWGNTAVTSHALVQAFCRQQMACITCTCVEYPQRALVQQANKKTSYLLQKIDTDPQTAPSSGKMTSARLILSTWRGREEQPTHPDLRR